MSKTSPFIFHKGRWHLDPTFNRKPTRHRLRNMLDALLETYPPKQILIFRPMTDKEIRVLKKYRA